MLVELRSHHILTFQEHIYWALLKPKWNLYDQPRFDAYTKHFRNFKRGFYQSLMENEETRIRVVANALDELCLECKRYRRMDCLQENDYDRLAAKDLGYRIGRIYVASDFVRKVRRLHTF
jgi:hypothetical protein